LISNAPNIVMSPKMVPPFIESPSNATLNRNSLQIFHETELGKVI